MGIISNFLYDVAAIRKYGLIRHVKYLFDIKHTIVNLHCLLDRIPDLEPIAGHELKEVNLYDRESMDVWISIVNEAFKLSSPFDYTSMRDYLLSHPYKKVEKIFIYLINSDPAGTFFVGTFRKDASVGCAGRFAVSKKHQRQGIGLELVKNALVQLKALGLTRYEEVFNYEKSYSYRVFMRCGAVPEFDSRHLVFKGTRRNILVKLWVKLKVLQTYIKIVHDLYRPFTTV